MLQIGGVLVLATLLACGGETKRRLSNRVCQIQGGDGSSFYRLATLVSLTGFTRVLTKPGKGVVEA